MNLTGRMSRFIALALTVLASPLMADQPKPWALGFQEAATPVMEQLNDLHNLVLIIICGIVLFVFCMLIFILIRFRASRNPVPSKTTHHTMLEVVWTIIPILILVVIAVPSFKLIFYSDKFQEPEMTVKVVGNMWFWTYEYKDHDISFDSNIIPDDKLQPGDIRLLSVDNQVVVPVGTNIRLLFTGADVIHSWAVPSFGVKKDCVPGRLNESWINIKREGTYYGQCSELCGMKHGFMPIVVKAVSKQEFQNWVEKNKNK